MTSYDICLSLSDSFHLVWRSLHLTMLLQMSLFHSFYGQVIFPCVHTPQASQVALVVKNPPASARDIRDTTSVPGSGGFPGLTPVFVFREFHGQRSLAGYSPGGSLRVRHLKQLSTHTCMHIPSVLYPFICLKKWYKWTYLQNWYTQRHRQTPKTQKTTLQFPKRKAGEGQIRSLGLTDTLLDIK